MVDAEIRFALGGEYQQPLAKKWDLSYYSLRHCNGRDNPEAHKLWFFPRKGVPSHEEPNLMGFSISGDRTFHDSREPAWAAGERTLVEV